MTGVSIYFPSVEDFADLKAGVTQILVAIATMEARMSAELDRLTTEVQETKTVQDSAIALLNGLSAQLRAIANDPAKINALADEMDANEKRLADAVAANTPNPPNPPTP